MSALPMFQRFSTGMAGTSSSMLPEPKVGVSSTDLCSGRSSSCGSSSGGRSQSFTNRPLALPNAGGKRERRFERWPLPSRTESLRSLRQHIQTGEQIERKLKSRHLTTIPPLRKRYLRTQHGQRFVRPVPCRVALLPSIHLAG
uniref:Uncharacterized protein n=1 Tax=Anopheles merus TaxID=30066 RepID=A0A182UR78_ANOME